MSQMKKKITINFENEVYKIDIPNSFDHLIEICNNIYGFNESLFMFSIVRGDTFQYFNNEDEFQKIKSYLNLKDCLINIIKISNNSQNDFDEKENKIKELMKNIKKEQINNKNLKSENKQLINELKEDKQQLLNYDKIKKDNEILIVNLKNELKENKKIFRRK